MTAKILTSVLIHSGFPDFKRANELISYLLQLITL
jgi:hypothetical protein